MAWPYFTKLTEYKKNKTNNWDEWSKVHKDLEVSDSEVSDGKQFMLALYFPILDPTKTHPFSRLGIPWKIS